MPTLQLSISPAQTPACYSALAEALTRITAQTLGKRAEVTAVLLHEVPPSRWFVGAQPVQAPTALLEISITQGTNTADQKSAFVVSAYAALAEHLGGAHGLETASYVTVREVPATDWGYGGRTQQARAHRAPAAQAG